VKESSLSLVGFFPSPSRLSPKFALISNSVVVLKKFQTSQRETLLRKLVPLGLFFCASFLSAQSPTPLPPMGADPITLASRQMEFLTRSVRAGREDEVRRAAATRSEEFARTQFLAKANNFVALWTDFASRLNEKQTFDVKLAKKLSKAFHELETSDGWLVREQALANNTEK
jgi:hypothetical protein